MTVENDGMFESPRHIDIESGSYRSVQISGFLRYTFGVLHTVVPANRLAAPSMHQEQIASADMVAIRQKAGRYDVD